MYPAPAAQAVKSDFSLPDSLKKKSPYTSVPTEAAKHLSGPMSPSAEQKRTASKGGSKRLSTGRRNDPCEKTCFVAITISFDIFFLMQNFSSTAFL